MNLARGGDVSEMSTVVRSWRYAGRGWRSEDDAWLAETTAGQAAEAGRAGYSERCRKRQEGR